MQPNVNPNPIPQTFTYPYYASSQYPYYYPNATPIAPPGVDPTPYPHVANSLLWAAKELHGSDPTGLVPAGSPAFGVAVPCNETGQLAIGQQKSTAWSNFTFLSQGNGTSKKNQKKTKVVQSAYCEVCRVDCNSKEVLDQHKLGKKHKKNLEKVLGQSTSVASTKAVSIKPVIGPQENPTKDKTSNAQKSRKRTADTPEDLERKRKKVVEGGAAVDAVRTCSYCNVVCNSEVVFKFHLAGQKHAAVLKKLGVSPAPTLQV